MAPPKVLIAGAGISGPALAFWLARFGCSVTIVERSSDLRATGQQIDFAGQALMVLQMIGIEDVVRAALCPESGMRLMDGNGKSVAFMPANKSDEKSLSGTKEFEIMRGDMVQILNIVTKNLPQVDYVFGTHVESFIQDEDTLGGKVHVTFSDGRQDDYDLFVGADGSGSATRELMLGPSHPDPRHDMGFHIAYFTAPPSSENCAGWTMCHLPGGKVVMTRKDSPANIRVYLLTTSDCTALDKADTLAEKKAALFETWKDTESGQLERFLQDLNQFPLSDDLYSQHAVQIRLPEGALSRGRVVLLGDAAYSTSVGGVGSSAALIGAYVLAGEIARQWDQSTHSLEKFDVSKAAEQYECIMRPLFGNGSFLPPWMLRAFVPCTTLGIWLLHVVVRFVVALRVDKLLASFASADEAQKFQYEDYFGAW